MPKAVVPTGLFPSFNFSTCLKLSEGLGELSQVAGWEPMFRIFIKYLIIGKVCELGQGLQTGAELSDKK